MSEFSCPTRKVTLNLITAAFFQVVSLALIPHLLISIFQHTKSKIVLLDSLVIDESFEGETPVWRTKL